MLRYVCILIIIRVSYKLQIVPYIVYEHLYNSKQIILFPLFCFSDELHFRKYVLY